MLVARCASENGSRAAKCGYAHALRKWFTSFTLREDSRHRPRYARPPRIPTVCHGHPVQILLLTFSLKQAWTRPFVKVFCGERGIRTPETLLEFTRFPGVPLQPLEHLSFALAISHIDILSDTIHLTTRKGTKNI